MKHEGAEGGEAGRRRARPEHGEALRAILEAAHEFARLTTSRDALVAAITAQAARLFDFESGGLRLLEGDALTLAGEWGAPVMIRPRIPWGESLSGLVAATGQILIAHDPGDDPRLDPVHREAERRAGHLTFVGAPLATEGRVTGVLILRSRRRRGLSSEERTRIGHFTEHAALALDNAHRYEEAVRQEREALTATQALAAERQEALERLRASQEHLIRTERLRALGEMASGVAHDFNNLLAVVLGRVQLLLMRTPDADVRRGLQVIESAANEAAQTVRRIQEFARSQRTGTWARVPLSHVVREVVELTRSRWRDEARVQGVTYTVTTELAEVPPVAGEVSELREVLANLVLNALDAMPAGGALHVAVQPADGWAVVTVRDTGHGMAHEVRERAFEPFFTTKGPRRTGLGLSVAYGIVRRHGGVIEMDSTEGAGTLVTLRLPVATDPPAAPPGRAPEAASRPDPVRLPVLLVEDEAPVREVLQDLLRSAGHVALAAVDGPSALALLEGGPPPALALVDLGLPGMSGTELAARLHERDPGLPVVLMTGWGEHPDTPALERLGIRQVLAKPFGAEQILALVRELGRPPAVD